MKENVPTWWGSCTWILIRRRVSPLVLVWFTLLVEEIVNFMNLPQELIYFTHFFRQYILSLDSHMSFGSTVLIQLHSQMFRCHFLLVITIKIFNKCLIIFNVAIQIYFIVWSMFTTVHNVIQVDCYPWQQAGCEWTAIYQEVILLQVTLHPSSPNVRTDNCLKLIRDACFNKA